jgi:hypothetical protein
VFMVLGGIQIVATTLIIIYAARYKHTPCPSHLPRRPTARTAARTGSSGDGPGSWRPSGRPLAGSAHPPSAVEHRARTSLSGTRNPVGSRRSRRLQGG